MSNSDSKAPAMIAWHIRKAGEKSYWDRIGAAFSHKDGQGLDVVLDSFPVDGRVTLRVPTEKSDAAE